MPALASYTDDQIADYMKRLGETNLQRIIGEGVPKDPVKRMIYEIVQVIMARYEDPAFRASRVGYIRDFDSRVPDGTMMAQDVLLMNSEAGAQAIKLVLAKSPKLAKACNFAAHAHHEPNVNFPYDGLVSLVFGKVDEATLRAFVAAFREAYPQAQAQGDIRMFEGISEATTQIAASLAQQDPEVAEIGLEVLNMIFDDPEMKKAVGTAVLAPISAKLDASIAANHTYYASLGIVPGKEPDAAPYRGLPALG